MEKKYLQFLGKATTAYDLLKYLDSQDDFTIQVPIDIRQILDYLDIPYSIKPNFKQVKLDGKISIENNEPLIWSNPMKVTIEERKRFTLAHELGHFLLHIAPLNDLSRAKPFEDSSITFNRDDNWDHKEMEANSFASQILMPSVMVTSETKKILENHPEISKIKLLEELAEIFFVSNTAMKYRLKGMGVKI